LNDVENTGGGGGSKCDGTAEASASTDGDARPVEGRDSGTPPRGPATGDDTMAAGTADAAGTGKF